MHGRLVHPDDGGRPKMVLVHVASESVRFRSYAAVAGSQIVTDCHQSSQAWFTYVTATTRDVDRMSATVMARLLLPSSPPAA